MLSRTAPTLERAEAAIATLPVLCGGRETGSRGVNSFARGFVPIDLRHRQPLSLSVTGAPGQTRRNTGF
jgi:hypothetical protein